MIHARFKPALDQALARLAQDRAQAGKTEVDVKRFTPLAQEQAISQEQLDDAVQANLAADALVKADEAAVENAQLNLGFTKITSPIDGLAGTALAQIGDLVGQSSSVLTTVSTINPIKVYFQVSEQSYLAFWRRLVGSGNADEISVAIDFFRRLGLSSNGEILLRRPAGQSEHRHTANLRTFSQREFHPAPWPIRPRPRANANQNERADCPATRRGPNFKVRIRSRIVGETNTAHLQPVTVGEQIGSDWIIESGLKPGDRVVVEGTQKAKEGAVVNPKPFGTETNQTDQAGTQTNSAAQTNPSK